MVSRARVLMVSAVASGQGKTTVTAALARKLRQSGRTVRVFKTGPDFIDPRILQAASGHAVYSLDLWMTGEQACRQQLAQAAQEADFILIEGVMGLYDGNPSSADLARFFDVPVLAVLDASAMAQTVGAVAMGLRDFGPVRLAGVIANRVASEGHAAMAKEAMRDIPLAGYLIRQKLSLPERHLGLVLPDEVEHLDALLDQMADALALDLAVMDAMPETEFADVATEPVPPLLQGKTIAVARDDAFAFLYPANLDCLQQLGAQLNYFSPLANEAVPASAGAVYLPGGYPELHAAALAENAVWLASVRDVVAAGKPVWAECGGMMALTDVLQDQAGVTHHMAAVLQGTAVMQEKLAALGPHFLTTAFGELRGHSFHYSRLETAMDAVLHTVRHRDQKSGEAVYQQGSLRASYFHAYFPSCPRAAAALFLGEAL